MWFRNGGVTAPVSLTVCLNVEVIKLMEESCSVSGVPVKVLPLQDGFDHCSHTSDEVVQIYSVLG